MPHATELTLRHPTVLAVLHAAQDMARSGTFPTHDHLCSKLKNIDEFEVRGVINLLVKLDRYPKPSGHEDDRVDQAAEMCRRNPGPSVSVRDFNLAVMKIIDGEDPYRSLSTITGLTVNALRIRASHARGYEDAAEKDEGLSGVERSYLTRAVERRLEMAHDPAVAEFAGKSLAARRAHPSRRSMTRDHAHDRSPHQYAV